MFRNIKQRALQKRTNRNLRNRDLSLVNAPLHTLGFLLEESLAIDLEFLYDFSATLGIQRKDIKLFTFIEVKKKLPTLRQNQIQNKEFSWKGEINSQNAQEFLDFPFDVLVGLYEKPHLYLDLLVSESKAKFKVGSATSDDRLYDLLLHMDLTDIEAFKKELKKYLKILNKI